MKRLPLIILLPLLCNLRRTLSFRTTHFRPLSSYYRPHIQQKQTPSSIRPCSDFSVLRLASEYNISFESKDPTMIEHSRANNTEIIMASSDEILNGEVSPIPLETKAATNTVNERLISEIQDALNNQKYGNTKNNRDLLKDFRSHKSEEERKRSIEEARDLNGVNPFVCIGGAAFAWTCAWGMWLCTTYLGVLFATHPIDTDIYFLERIMSVFRNVVMGMISLASGFFGVVGLGIFLLGVRVAFGVMMGELDPTPIQRSKSDEIVLPDVWSLMMGRKPRQRGK